MSEAGAGPAWSSSARRHERTRIRAERKPRKLYTGPALVAGFIVIEGLLALRIFGQATSQGPDSGFFRPVLFLTDLLVAPFREVRPEYTAKDTGIIEFSTLLAFEAYLVLGLALVFLVQATRISAWFARRHRRAQFQTGFPMREGEGAGAAAPAAPAAEPVMAPAVSQTPDTRAA